MLGDYWWVWTILFKKLRKTFTFPQFRVNLENWRRKNAECLSPACNDQLTMWAFKLFWHENTFAQHLYLSALSPETRPSKMEVYHRGLKNIIVHTGHMEWFEQRDWKEQQNIIDWVNHIGRIVKYMLPVMSAFGAKAVGTWNYFQLGNFSQLGHLGQFGELLGQFVAF